MFWWSRKPKIVVEDISKVLQLAQRLGVEKRQFVRVRYPRRTLVCNLPQISFEDYVFRVHDISLGGCCLLDPEHILGPAVGHEIELKITWPGLSELVQARIVSRVDHRRHIQFLDLNHKRQVQLKKSMASGVRGLSVRHHSLRSHTGPSMDAVELWSSIQGDSVVLDSNVHRIAQIHFESEEYSVFREAWPVKGNQDTCSRPELDHLILFLANIPSPTKPLLALIAGLEGFLQEGAP